MPGKIDCNILDTLFQRAFFCKQKPISTPDIMDLFARKPAPFQAHHIETCQMGAVSKRNAIRNHVVFNAGKPTYESVRPDPAKLMHGSAPPEDSEISHDTMPRQHDVIGKNNMVPDNTIMRNMRTR
jgi:hypothetical protein